MTIGGKTSQVSSTRSVRLSTCVSLAYSSVKGYFKLTTDFISPIILNVFFGMLKIQ